MSTVLLPVVILFALGQSHVDEKLPPLNRTQAKKLLRESERELVAAKLRGDCASGMNDSSPLVNRICEFRINHFVRTHVEGNYILRGEIDAGMEELLPLSVVDPEGFKQAQAKGSEVRRRLDDLDFEKSQAERERGNNRAEGDDGHERRKRELRREKQEALEALGAVEAAHCQALESLRHEIRVTMPEDFRPPDRIRRWIGNVKVEHVEWDCSKKLPRLIIHAWLVKSEDLKMNAVGLIEDVAVKVPPAPTVAIAEDNEKPVECMYVHLTASNLEIGNCDTVPVEVESLAIDTKYALLIQPDQRIVLPGREMAIPFSKIPGFPVDDFVHRRYTVRLVHLMTDSGEFTFNPKLTSEPSPAPATPRKGW